MVNQITRISLPNNNACHVAQVPHADLDLRTVKHTIWKSGGDMRLHYREIEPRTITSMSTSSNNVDTSVIELYCNE